MIAPDPPTPTPRGRASNGPGDDVGGHPWPAAAPPGRHGPDTAHRAAHRARAIFDAGPRTELAGAAEFLHALLRVPDDRPAGTGDVR